MGLGKQAKTLSKDQVDAMLAYLSTTRHAKRNRLIFLLSAKAGLRAKEIAKLTWWMTNDSQGKIAWEICLLDSASKGKSGRRIPLNNEVRNALIEYRDEVLAKARPNDMSPSGPLVIKTERSQSTSAQAIVNMFQRWYRHVGFVGCSSHSGRRTFITNAARKISTVGGSHASLAVESEELSDGETSAYLLMAGESQIGTPAIAGWIVLASRSGHEA